MTKRKVIFTHDEIVDYLLSVFKNEESDLQLLAASDTTSRRNLRFILNFEMIGDDSLNFGGTVNYNKKARRFDFVEYCDNHGWAVRVSIESRVSYFCRDHYLELRKNFPFGCSVKKLKGYLLSH